MSIKRKLDKLEKEAAELLLTGLATREGRALFEEKSEAEAFRHLRSKLPKAAVEKLEERERILERWFREVNRHILGDSKETQVGQ